MRFLCVAAAAAALVSTTAAAPTVSSRHVLHEKRSTSSHKWHKRSRAMSDHVMPMRIALRERNVLNTASYVDDISNPNSPNFGKHWSAEKVANTFAAHPQTKDAVMDWLEQSGIDRSRMSFSTGHNWLHFDGTVAEAEKLFATEYYQFEHKQSGDKRLACDHYSLPEHVKEHIDFAMPTVQLEGIEPVKNSITNLQLAADFPNGASLGTEPCGKLITIDCLRELYNFGPGNTSVAGNEIGVAEWADYLNEPDLPTFFKNFTSPEIPADTVPEFIAIDGGLRANATTVSQESGVESALDFQSVYSVVYPQKVRLYQVGDGVNVDSVGTFNIWLDALDASYCTFEGGDQPYVDPQYPDPNDNLQGYQGPLQCGGAPLSNVFSVSYGQIEGALPTFYQVRQCNEWAKLALQGVSVIYASGDSGVANRFNSGYPNSCLSGDPGELYVDNNGTRYSPSFPVNCPYITAVGATTLNGANVSSGERAVSSFGSGGGFSDIFPAPDYQADIVAAFQSTYGPNYGPNVYNNSGKARGFPDVSAIGENVATVFNGRTLGVGGTSAAAPIFAGLVTLINEARIAAGKGPVGFLNPTLYANPGAFNDITIGSNPGCNTGGFNATPGWDPVTGLGTPNFEKLRDVFLALP